MQAACRVPEARRMLATTVLNSPRVAQPLHLILLDLALSLDFLISSMTAYGMTNSNKDPS